MEERLGFWLDTTVSNNDSAQVISNNKYLMGFLKHSGLPILAFKSLGDNGAGLC
jgi:hypothetical protein